MAYQYLPHHLAHLVFKELTVLHKGRSFLLIIIMLCHHSWKPEPTPLSNTIFFEDKCKTRFLATDLPWVTPPQSEDSNVRCHMSWKIWKQYSSIWRPHISYSLPKLIEQVWLCLLEKHWSGIKRAKVFSTSPVQHLRSSASKVHWLQNCLLPPSWWTRVS